MHTVYTVSVSSDEGPQCFPALRLSLTKCEILSFKSWSPNIQTLFSQIANVASDVGEKLFLWRRFRPNVPHFVSVTLHRVKYKMSPRIWWYYSTVRMSHAGHTRSQHIGPVWKLRIEVQIYALVNLHLYTCPPLPSRQQHELLPLPDGSSLTAWEIWKHNKWPSSELFAVNTQSIPQNMRCLFKNCIRQLQP